MFLPAGCGVVVWCLASLFSIAGTDPLSWVNSQGFRELQWGASLSQAKAVYPDLRFARYAMTGEKEAPSSVYERKGENNSINGVKVHEIRYWFRNDSFYMVRMSMKSKVGPRTLSTPASEAFDELFGKVRNAMGAPVEHRLHWGGSESSRSALWSRGDMSVALLTFDPPGSNEEELVLEIVKKPTVLSPRVPE
jgi:hypothetical protein